MRAAVWDHGGGEGPRKGMVMSGGGEITTPGDKVIALSRVPDIVGDHRRGLVRAARGRRHMFG
jgi:hypothetical protein